VKLLDFVAGLRSKSRPFLAFSGAGPFQAVLEADPYSHVMRDVSVR
jgi:hypothetical protein